ncbi:MAG: hypothetical protein ACRDD1_02900, partial [Planctomycetia bacterium]
FDAKRRRVDAVWTKDADPKYRWTATRALAPSFHFEDNSQAGVANVTTYPLWPDSWPPYLRFARLGVQPTPIAAFTEASGRFNDAPTAGPDTLLVPVELDGRPAYRLDVVGVRTVALSRWFDAVPPYALVKVEETRTESGRRATYRLTNKTAVDEATKSWRPTEIRYQKLVGDLVVDDEVATVETVQWNQPLDDEIFSLPRLGLAKGRVVLDRGMKRIWAGDRFETGRPGDALSAMREPTRSTAVDPLAEILQLAAKLTPEQRRLLAELLLAPDKKEPTSVGK